MQDKKNDDWSGCVGWIVVFMIVAVVAQSCAADDTSGSNLSSNSGDVVPWFAGGGGGDDAYLDFQDEYGSGVNAATQAARDDIIYENMGSADDDDPYIDEGYDPGPPDDYYEGGDGGGSNFSWDGVSDVDCKELENRRVAQAFYVAQGGPAQDPHYLDGDSDGLACENLPD